MATLGVRGGEITRLNCVYVCVWSVSVCCVSVRHVADAEVEEVRLTTATVTQGPC